MQGTRPRRLRDRAQLREVLSGLVGRPRPLGPHHHLHRDDRKVLFCSGTRRRTGSSRSPAADASPRSADMSASTTGASALPSARRRSSCASAKRPCRRRKSITARWLAAPGRPLRERNSVASVSSRSASAQRLPRQHRSVVRPTGPDDEVDPPPVGVLWPCRTTPPRAREVAHALARIEQQATRPARGLISSYSPASAAAAASSRQPMPAWV